MCFWSQRMSRNDFNKLINEEVHSYVRLCELRWRYKWSSRGITLQYGRKPDNTSRHMVCRIKHLFEFAFTFSTIFPHFHPPFPQLTYTSCWWRWWDHAKKSMVGCKWSRFHEKEESRCGKCANMTQRQCRFGSTTLWLNPKGRWGVLKKPGVSR